ncbi:MAG: ATP-binding cassette domain-containing protein [Acidimicrobiales bacterium]
MPLAVRAHGLVKRFGPTVALDGLDLEVEEASVLGVLGPNGAGKTTAVRILATLLAPDAGVAEVAGFDVLRQPQEVRSVIGLTGQYAAVDENLTGFENLDMIGRLAQLGKGRAHRRAGELLEQFDLSHAGGRPARTYSGGMRRRLDLAASLVGRPVVLFLDEPTSGLDPQSRNALWEVVRSLVADGTTILLTTQYLEEADQLADTIAVIDGGRVIASGTPTDLKASVGGEVLALQLAHPEQVEVARQALGALGAEARVEGATISLPVGEDKGILSASVRRLDEAGIRLADLGTRRPSLDDVFLALTGHTAEGGETDGPALPRRGRSRRKEAAR